MQEPGGVQGADHGGHAEAAEGVLAARGQVRGAGHLCRTEEESVYGSKGLGEPPLSLATSVVCALREAVGAYREQEGAGPLPPLTIPLTAERLRLDCEDEVVRAAEGLQGGRRQTVFT